LGDGRNGERVLHATVIRVGLGKKLFVRVNLIIVEQLVAQIVAELRKKTAGDERRWSCIDSWFALRFVSKGRRGGVAMEGLT